jgi:hypothetical protein
MHEKFIDSHGAGVLFFYCGGFAKKHTHSPPVLKLTLLREFLPIYLMTCVFIGACLINPKTRRCREMESQYKQQHRFSRSLSNPFTSTKRLVFCLTLINCHQSHHFLGLGMHTREFIRLNIK